MCYIVCIEANRCVGQTQPIPRLTQGLPSDQVDMNAQRLFVRVCRMQAQMVFLRRCV